MQNNWRFRKLKGGIYGAFEQITYTSVSCLQFKMLFAHLISHAYYFNCEDDENLWVFFLKQKNWKCYLFILFPWPYYLQHEDDENFWVFFQIKTIGEPRLKKGRYGGKKQGFNTSLSCLKLFFPSCFPCLIIYIMRTYFLVFFHMQKI